MPVPGPVLGWVPVVVLGLIPGPVLGPVLLRVIFLLHRKETFVGHMKAHHMPALEACSGSGHRIGDIAMH